MNTLSNMQVLLLILGMSVLTLPLLLAYSIHKKRQYEKNMRAYFESQLGVDRQGHEDIDFGPGYEHLLVLAVPMSVCDLRCHIIKGIGNVAVEQHIRIEW